MELSPYIESLKNSLQAASAPAGKEISETATLLTHALEPASYLCLMDAMSEAADEITVALNDIAVEARLHGRQIKFAVNELEQHGSPPAPAGDPSSPETSDNVARITLRIPESVKDSVERAAGAKNVSVNGWLVNAITSALDGDLGTSLSPRKNRRNRSFKGFARS
jgi:hypothetical protein